MRYFYETLTHVVQLRAECNAETSSEQSSISDQVFTFRDSEVGLWQWQRHDLTTESLRVT